MDSGDAVSTGVVEQWQTRTVWNLSDIGTKSLGTYREVRRLLHELNMATGKDSQVIGRLNTICNATNMVEDVR